MNVNKDKMNMVSD